MTIIEQPPNFFWQIRMDVPCLERVKRMIWRRQRQESIRRASDPFKKL